MTTPIHVFPAGEQVVAMTVVDGKAMVATNRAVYLSDDEGRLVALEIVPAAEKVSETQVWGGEG